MSPGQVAYGLGGIYNGYVLTIDPATNRGYAVVKANPQTGSVVRQYDLSTFRAISDIVAPLASGFGQGTTTAAAAGNGPLAVVDQKRHRVIYALDGEAKAAAGTCADSSGTDNWAVLDEDTRSWSQLPIGCLPRGIVPGTGTSLLAGLTGGGDDAVVAGLDYDVAYDQMYAVLADSEDETQDADGGSVRHYLERVSDLTGAVSWRIQLPDCNHGGSFDLTAPYGGGGAIMVGRHGNQIDVLCLENNNQQEVNSGQGILPLLVRVVLGADGAPTGQLTEAITLGHSFGGAFDPGSGGIVQASTLAGYDYGSYVVDGASGLFRGFVATGADTQFNGPDDPHEAGMDPTRSRIYMRTRAGLIVSDIDRTPVPVGSVVRSVGDPWNYANGGIDLPISVDPVRHRLYVFDYTQKVYLVYEDHLPVASGRNAFDPDSETRDLTEAPGVTGVTYSASGDAFGARFLSEGGPGRNVNNDLDSCPNSAPVTTGASPSLDQLLLAGQECQGNLVLTPGDREWLFGDVAQLTSSTVGVATQAAGIDIEDGATAKDLSRAGVYGTAVPTTSLSIPGASPISLPPTPVTVPGPAETPTPAPPVQSRYGNFPADRPQDRPRCFDAGSSPGGGEEDTATGAARVNCDQAGTSVSAVAVAGAGGPTVADPTSTPSPGVVQLGEYWSQIWSHRDPVKGLVTVATADAHNVVIPIAGQPSVLIRDVITKGEVSAHGRPGTATGSFSRAIFGFQSIGAPGTPGDYSCSDDTESPCDPQRVAGAITYDLQQAGFTAQATVPNPDPSYIGGSARGYQAIITKDAAQRTNDQTVNDDASDTVDGLQIVIVEDGSAGKTREVLQLAGLHIESHYGIYLLAADGGSFGGASTDAAVPAAGTTGVVGNMTSGTVSTVGGVSLPNSNTNPLVAVAHHIADVFQEGWRLLVSDPKTAALLAGVWGLLGMPVYLAIRRRSLVSKIARGVA